MTESQERYDGKYIPENITTNMSQENPPPHHYYGESQEYDDYRKFPLHENCEERIAEAHKQISELQSKLSELEKERDSLLSSRVESQPFYYKEWEKIKARNAELEKITQHWVDIESFYKLRMESESKINELEQRNSEIEISLKEFGEELDRKNLIIKELEQKLLLKDQVLDADEKRIFELEQKLAAVSKEKEAKAIIHTQDHELDYNKRMNTQTISREYAYIRANGYLECFEQMKPLVEALETILSSNPELPLEKQPNIHFALVAIAREALSRWRKVQGDKTMKECALSHKIADLEAFEQMKPLVNLIVSIQTWAKVHKKVEIRRLCDETLSNFRKVSEDKP